MSVLQIILALEEEGTGGIPPCVKHGVMSLLPMAWKEKKMEKTGRGGEGGGGE